MNEATIELLATVACDAAYDDYKADIESQDHALELWCENGGHASGVARPLSGYEQRTNGQPAAFSDGSDDIQF